MMAKLYEIDEAILECIDDETGEIIDPVRLEQLALERDAKIEGVALWVKNLLSDADAFEAEKKRFEEREKAARKKAESLKKWLSFALNGSKFETNRVSISFRKSESVEIEDYVRLPLQYIKEKVEYSPDKTAIKTALKSGKSIEGCSLSVKQNIQIN